MQCPARVLLLLTIAWIVAAAAVPKASAAQLDTNAVVNATLHVPAFAGQILIGTASNVVFVAKGTTTNDWVDVSEPE